MHIGKASHILPSEITPRRLYLDRRNFLLGGAALGIAGGYGGSAVAAPLQAAKSPFSTDEKPTPLKDVTTYNNFYEFGTDKSDPAANAGSLKTSPGRGAARGQRQLLNT